MRGPRFRLWIRVCSRAGRERGGRRAHGTHQRQRLSWRTPGGVQSASHHAALQARSREAQTPCLLLLSHRGKRPSRRASVSHRVVVPRPRVLQLMRLRLLLTQTRRTLPSRRRRLSVRASSSSRATKAKKAKRQDREGGPVSSPLGRLSSATGRNPLHNLMKSSQAQDDNRQDWNDREKMREQACV